MIDVTRSVDKTTKRSCLTKERIELPELLLLPLIERMVVALRALNLQPQKDAAGAAGREHPFFVIDLVDQKVHRAVEVRLARLGRTLRR